MAKRKYDAWLTGGNTTARECAKPKAMNNFIEQWDDNEFPLAYLTTIRTYGTWLHGDKRKSVDLHGKNVYGTPKRNPNRNLEKIMKRNIAQDAVVFDKTQRKLVEESFKDTCKARKYDLLAVNIRTNHAHAVISAASKPEKIINGLKAHATRKLRENHLVLKDQQIWSRGGSRRYLWKPRHVNLAIDYVLYGQGLLPFELE